ncbi:nucleoside monophosphate kinase [Thermosulfurimonas dismutans]|uniref:Adenylate kinase n=1 Tax=Thermosulfurimonas dismutans TaxID=999894 RepID=A0A179D712_9BACT|nr:nucleoside monophosphate kinase [Thermosulfurimonas dismutans]OAQ21763.1 Adenylate kinase [Thermosulfurimonas dismutans]
MRALHLIGPTGSGKTPLGETLQTRGLFGHRTHHFDFGAELRRVARGEGPPEILPEEVDFIKRVLSEGLLLENEHFYLAEKIFQAYLRQKGVRAEDLIVLNGLPRHEGQARDMERLVEIKLCVELAVDKKILQFRLSKDPAGDRREREDDLAELVARKLEWYYKRTLPLKDYYRERKIPVLTIPVEKEDTGENLYQKLLEFLSEKEFKIIFSF